MAAINTTDYFSERDADDVWFNSQTRWNEWHNQENKPEQIHD